MMSGPQVYGAKAIADDTSKYDSAGCTSADLLSQAQMAKLAKENCPKGHICTPKNPTGGSMSTYMMIGVVGLLGVGAFVYSRK